MANSPDNDAACPKLEQLAVPIDCVGLEIRVFIGPDQRWLTYTVRGLHNVADHGAELLGSGSYDAPHVGMASLDLTASITSWLGFLPEPFP